METETMNNNVTQQEQDVEINFSKIEEQCSNWRKKGYKIMLVYQPITGTLSRDFYTSMLSTLSGEVWVHMLDRYKIVMKPMVSGHFPIDANRNMAIMDALNRYKADYMMFMDTDQTFQPKAIVQLFETLLEKDEQYANGTVAAGMYFVKKHPWRAVFGNYVDWDETSKSHKKALQAQNLIHNDKQLLWWQPTMFWDKDQTFKVDVIGAGCMMMSKKVLEKLEYPYFKYIDDPRTPGKKGSEDMWFCSQLHKQGIPIFMDSRVSCGHLSDYTVDENLFQATRDSMFEALTPEKRKKIYAKAVDVRVNGSKTEWQEKMGVV